MPDFFWRAAKPDAQVVTGRLHAASRSQALQQLRSQGLTLLEMREGLEAPATALAQQAKPEIPRPRRKLFSSGEVNKGDILIMTSELSIMLNAGLALDNALRVLIGMSSKPAMAALTQQILDDVKSGKSLSRVLEVHPQHFGSFYINMVRSGEASGQMSAVLARLVEHLERLRALRESVISAIIYPCILLAVAILSLVAMLGFVVPQFQTLFDGMGDALPLPTRIVMAAAHLFRENAPLLGLGLLFSFLSLRAWWRSPRGSLWWQTRVLRLPVLGALMLKYDLTLFARSLGTLLGNGVALLAALNIATQTVGNTVLRQALEGAIPKVKGGAKMVDALRSSGVFEPLAISLIQVGEETGRMGPMLIELAQIFNRDVETGIKRGLTLLEPLLILVLGLVIASVIVSILLGILSINDLAV